MFHGLEREDIRAILATMLETISHSMDKRHSVTLEIDENAVDILIEKGYSPNMGRGSCGGSWRWSLSQRLPRD
jgi:ATP-dependent Clp protease ATP-binding subunit ClpA